MDNLARDSTRALAAGMSYGKWKALHPHTAEPVPEKPKENAKLCRRCGKEIPKGVYAGRKYCCDDCKYAAGLERANERYWAKKEKKDGK